jgi:tetratricopeptide (TPR) repeat protein
MIELLLAGDRLLEAGDLDRAERIYRQVADADPRNAIAVVGLARVADARGSRDEAVALATRALAIDPEDQAAQRLGAELARPAPPAPEAPTAPSAAAPGRRSLLDRLKALLRRGGG